MNDRFESMRMLQEMALNSGKKRRSAQTGYLHYCYNLNEQEPHLPIPLFENFLFALILLRSKTVENIQEARLMLEGLLHFQNKSDGNFPIYLHHFPACKDRFTGIKVSGVIYWILKQFKHVVGQELKTRLEEALLSSIKHALHAHAEKPATYPTALRIAAVATASGQLLEETALKDRGWQMLDQLKEHPDEQCLLCPESLGSMAVSLLMVYPKLSEGPWAFFWNHLQSTWHRETAMYCGPALKEWQQSTEPQVTLYDLVCGYLGERFSDRALKDSPIHLDGVLIPFSEERFGLLNYPLEINGSLQKARWKVYHGDKIAFSTIDKGSIEINPVYEKGFSPFKLIWGDLHRSHTFVSQGTSAKTITFNQTEMIFDLDMPVDTDDKEKNREILFFVDIQEDLEFLVSGKRASTFLLGEELTLKTEVLKLTLSFHLDEGEGRFLGHWMQGNRPSQIDNKGESRFKAYDWQMFLRTVSRSDKCRIRVNLKLENA